MNAACDVQIPSGMLLGGGLVDDAERAAVPHVNPATGRRQAHVLMAGAKEVDAAVADALDAAPSWRAWSPNERRDVLLAVAALFDQHAHELATLGVLENGTPASLAEAACATFPAEYFRYYAGWCDKVRGDVVPVYPGRALDYVVREPCGVVAQMVPWNGPAGLIGMKLPAALAAGNCVIVKPSELAPFTALRIGLLCRDAGIPPGVVSVLPGDAETGSALVRHPAVGKISFTGGTETGRVVMRRAADNLTPVSLELGGKSANLVFADADIDAAVAMAVQAGLAMQSGQACMAPSRLLIERAVYTEVVDQVVDLAGCLEVGDPFDPGTIMGPLISAGHCARVLDIIAAARDRGDGALVSGGHRLSGDLSGGFFVEPTVFADVDPQSMLAQTEVFGPVLSIIPFDSEEEAVAIANATPFGLAGFIFTSDLARAHRVASVLEAGYIGINQFPLLPPAAPFGGYKQSGFGRELGLDGLHEFTRTKNVCVSLER